MSQENVEIVRESLERYAARREFVADVTDDFVLDMSNFHGWPEQQVYQGLDGARAFLGTWMDAWGDWEHELEALHDAGDRVVSLVHQRLTSKTVGTPVEMSFAHVFTLRDGKLARVELYSDRDEALAAAGLAE
jgi:uncharacterized protein